MFTRGEFVYRRDNNMKKLLVFVLFIATLVLLSFHQPTHVTAQTRANTAIFGEITVLQFVTSELVNVSVITKDGIQRFSVNANSQLIIPGKKSPSNEELAVGNFIVAIVPGGEEDLEAIQILVKPEHPVTVHQLTGVITSSDTHRISFIDKYGNILLLRNLISDFTIPDGEAVTLTIRKNTETNELYAIDVAAIKPAVMRLSSALNSASKNSDLERADVYRHKITNAIIGHLSLLQDAINRAPQQLKLSIDRNLTKSLSDYSSISEDSGLLHPEIQQEGLLESIDPQDIESNKPGILYIQLDIGIQLELKFDQDTQKLFRNEDIELEPGNIGNWIVVRYNPVYNHASYIEIKAPSLSDSVSSKLINLVHEGEASGILSSITTTFSPPIISITTDTNTLIILKVPVDAITIIAGQQTSLSLLQTNSKVKVKYDPKTNEAMEIMTFADKPGEEFITGVVTGVIGKLRTINIMTPSGTTQEFVLPNNVPIQHNGKFVSIAEVKLGQIVRPTTKYSDSSKEILWLSLDTAPTTYFHGLILGKVVTQNQQLLTISPDRGISLTLKITQSTELIKDQNNVSLEEIFPGDIVLQGTYHPVSHAAINIDIASQ